MGDKIFDGTVRSVLVQDRRKAEEHKEIHKITVRDAEGIKQAILTAPKGYFDGFNPDDLVTISIKNAQTKL